VSDGVEFDWDAANTRHLKRHRVTPAEFEELMNSEPIYLDYQTQTGEERYKVLGEIKSGRLLIGVWTPRGGKVRAITAYTARRAYQAIYREAQT
jgi:uncharacterized DUF497 family protein